MLGGSADYAELADYYGYYGGEPRDVFALMHRSGPQMLFANLYKNTNDAQFGLRPGEQPLLAKSRAYPCKSAKSA